MVKVLDCGLELNGFKSRDYFPFRINAHWERSESTYPSSYRLKSITAVFYKDGFGIKWPIKFDMLLIKNPFYNIIILIIKQVSRLFSYGHFYW